MITTYNSFFHHPKNSDIKNNEKKNCTISQFYYKNPFFYNEENLDLQLKILKELNNLKINRNPTPLNINQNTYSKTSNFFNKKNFSIYEKSESNNNLSNNYSSFENTFTNFKFPNIPKIKDNKNTSRQKYYENVFKNKTVTDDDTLKNNFLIKNTKDIDKISKDITNSNINFKDAPKNFKENDDYFYRIVFKSKPYVRIDQNKIIDNKLNMKYAENEEQYKRIIEREYKKLLSEGKKIKSKNVSPSINLKLNDAKDKIRFMKGVIDYSYPSLILSKIKLMQKKLNEHKKKSMFLHCLSPKELRIKEKKNRNNSRREYLLNSITLIK